MAERNGLLNRRRGNSTEGSNPSLSDIAIFKKISAVFVLTNPVWMMLPPFGHLLISFYPKSPAHTTWFYTGFFMLCLNFLFAAALLCLYSLVPYFFEPFVNILQRAYTVLSVCVYLYIFSAALFKPDKPRDCPLIRFMIDRSTRFFRACAQNVF